MIDTPNNKRINATNSNVRGNNVNFDRKPVNNKNVNPSLKDYYNQYKGGGNTNTMPKTNNSLPKNNQNHNIFVENHLMSSVNYNPNHAKEWDFNQDKSPNPNIFHQNTQSNQIQAPQYVQIKMSRNQRNYPIKSSSPNKFTNPQDTNNDCNSSPRKKLGQLVSNTNNVHNSNIMNLHKEVKQYDDMIQNYQNQSTITNTVRNQVNRHQLNNSYNNNVIKTVKLPSNKELSKSFDIHDLNNRGYPNNNTGKLANLYNNNTQHRRNESYDNRDVNNSSNKKSYGRNYEFRLKSKRQMDFGAVGKIMMKK